MSRPATLDTSDLRVALGRPLEIQRLRLSRQKLETLPAGILGLANLEKLEIDNNPFQDLEGVIAQLQALPKLRELRIDADANGCWPSGFDKLAHLEILKLHSPICGRQPDYVSEMPNLKAIHYNVSDWVGDPSRFTPLVHAKGLEEIFLYFNGPMPTGLGVLKQVKRLLVRDPVQLPDDVCAMESLEELHLLAIHWNNKIQALPAAIGQLQQLKKIRLKAQRMHDLPPSFADLRALEVVEMDNNAFTEMPAALAGLSLLREIDFSGNAIQTVPDWVADLSALQSLNLTGTKVSKLPAHLDRCKDLSTLLLDECAFKEFPEVALACPALTQLSLRVNKIPTLPASAGKVQQKLFIDLQRNAVATLPWQIADAPQLTVNFEGNPLAKTSGYKLDRTLVYIGEDNEQLGQSHGARYALYALAMNDLNLASQKATQTELINFLNASDNTIRGRAVELLSQLFPNPFDAEELPTKIAFLGKATTLKPAELKKLFQEKGLLQMQATDPEVQVLVLGEKPGAIAVPNHTPAPFFATPSHFQALIERLNGAWVKNAAAQSPKVADNLMALLASKDRKNLELAFTMLAAGGMPIEAASAVLSIGWWNADAKVRKAAVELWKQHASSAAQAHLLANKRNVSSMKPEKLEAYFHDLATLADFDFEVMVRFAKLYKGEA